MNGNVIDRIFFILRAQIRFKFYSMKNIQLILFIFLTLSLHAQTNYKTFMEDIDSMSSKYSEIAQTIWNYAEMGYQEKQSSALLQKTLSDAGFTVEKGVAGIPTAFSATFGTNGPVIAILGEYDALPGLSQKNVPYKISNNTRAGHGCGHHLFGTASAAAAIAIKNYLEETGKPGTIKFFGCPA